MTSGTIVELTNLMQLAAQGDRSAFAHIYGRTSAKLFGVILRILPRKELAEEALQETYVQVWQRAGQFDPAKGSPITWLVTIARNKAIDLRRQRPEIIAEMSVELDENVMSLNSATLANSETTDTLRRLQECLKEIPEMNAEMVLMAYYQGWSRKELAHRYNRPVASVKTILRRSLIALKECLDG